MIKALRVGVRGEGRERGRDGGRERKEFVVLVLVYEKGGSRFV